MPSLGQYIHLDVDEYRWKIRLYSNEKLQKNIYKKRANKLSGKIHFCVSAVASPLTGGGAVIPLLANGNGISVTSQKLNMLEVEWAGRGFPALPHRVLKDCFFTATIAGATSVFAASIGIGLDTTPAVSLDPLAYPTVERFVAAVGEHYMPEAVGNFTDYAGGTAATALVKTGTGKR